jgi:hypothetical protein
MINVTLVAATKNHERRNELARRCILDATLQDGLGREGGRADRMSEIYTVASTMVTYQ